MSFFTRPSIFLLLLAIFVVVGAIGGFENDFDHRTILALRDIRTDSPELTKLLVLITHSGSAYATIGGGLLVAVWLLLQRAWARAALLVGVVVIERMVMDGLKLLLARPRPTFDAHPVLTHSSSFPSGHSANTMAVFLAIALIAVPHRHRVPAVTAAVIASLLIGVTRPYLGVHWPTDVIGGWALGLMSIWVAMTIGDRAGLLVEAKHEVVSGHLPPVREDEAA
jgi:undecaprenyl-diphosphatase